MTKSPVIGWRVQVVDSPFGPGVDPVSPRAIMNGLPDERTSLLRRTSTSSTKQRRDPTDLSAARRRGILAGLWLGTFLGAMNTTLVATLMSAISSGYGSANQGAWLGTAFLLATCTFTPLYGRLCTVLGRRGAHQLALAFAALGTLGCGLAPGIEMLIAARFLTGLGGGGLFVTAGIVTADMYSMRDRSLTQGIASVVNGGGLGIGGFLGGAIMDRLGWRWAFFIQLPFFLLAFTLTTLFLDYDTPGSAKKPRDVLKRIDYGGVFSLLLFVGSALTFLACKFNADYSWSHPYVFAPLIVLCVSLIAFIVIELYLTPEPIMPPFLLHQRIPTLVAINNVLVSICNFSITYFFPMWFETVKLVSAGEAGAHIAPNSVSMSLGSLFAGWLMHRTGKYKTLNVVFGILPTIAAILIATLDERSPEWVEWGSIIPLGFGNSVVLQTTLIALLASVDRPSMAVAMGFVQLFSGFGQVSGVAVSSAIFQYILRRELKARLTGPDSAELIERIKRSSEIVRQLPRELQQPVKDSYATALTAVFTLAAACTFAAFLVRLPIPELSMDEDTPEQTSDTKSVESHVHFRSLTPLSRTPSENGSSRSTSVERGRGLRQQRTGLSSRSRGPGDRRRTSPSRRLIDFADEEEAERAHGDSTPIPIPGRPTFNRLTTFQNTPMDVERGRSARKLRNSKPRDSI